MVTTEKLRISWSQLHNHETCRQKSFLLRAGKSSPAKNIRNYWHGLVVDRVMRQWLTDPQPGAMPALVDHEMRVGEQQAREAGDGIVRWRHASDRADVHAYCTELVTRLEPLLRQHVLTYDQFGCGIRFTEPATIPSPDGPRPVDLVGEMDLLVDTPTGRVVLDLKGTADDQYWRRVIGQLVFYDLALLARYRAGTAWVGLLQPMCTQPVIRFTVTDDLRRQLWNRIVRMANQIWANDNACKDTTAGCSWCEVRHACPRYSDLAVGLRTAAKGTL